MRDYHRRRMQKATRNDVPISGPAPKPPSAKGQTHKFRFGGEKGLRPWVPVKGPPGKRRKTGKGRGTVLGSAEVGQISNASTPINRGQLPPDSALSNQEFTSTSLKEYEPVAPNADKWLSSLAFAIETSTLFRTPGSGFLDPFAATSLLITPRTQILIHHYFSDRLQSSWLMLPMRKMLFSLAINDAAMFHSFLCHYSGSYNVHFKTGNRDEALYHASQAARIVNERLADPNQALTNETIATVANMAAFESSNGSVESMLVHVDGLVRMVQMRGGIQSGGFPMIVQRMIAWTDYHAATAVLRQPRFPPLNIPETERPEDYFYPPVSNPSDPSRFREDGETMRDMHDHSLGRLLAGVRDLSKLLKELKRLSNLPEDNIWYSDKIYYLQRNLIEVVYCPNTPRPVDRVCAMAALMYCGHCLRDVPLTFQVIARAVTRLKAAIIDYEKNMSSEPDKEEKRVMFWILGFGGVAAVGKPERDWFVANFRAICDDLDVNDWEKANGMLKDVLWQADLDDGGSKLWLEAILGNFSDLPPDS
ncbi:Fungal specific transcription factor domain containing protein [Hyaloscypha variabilis]